MSQGELGVAACFGGLMVVPSILGFSGRFAVFLSILLGSPKVSYIQRGSSSTEKYNSGSAVAYKLTDYLIILKQVGMSSQKYSYKLLSKT